MISIIDATKLGVPASLISAILNAGEQQVQGVDSNRSALVFVKKIGDIYMAGIRYEERVGNYDFFTVRHDDLFYEDIEVAKFFADYNLGDITWIKDYPPTEEELQRKIEDLEELVQLINDRE